MLHCEYSDTIIDVSKSYLSYITEYLIQLIHHACYHQCAFAIVIHDQLKCVNEAVICSPSDGI